MIEQNLEEIIEHALEGQRNAILSQLNEFIGCGVLDIEVNGTSLVQNHDRTIDFLQNVELKLRDKELIDDLMGENMRLRATLQDMELVRDWPKK